MARDLRNSLLADSEHGREVGAGDADLPPAMDDHASRFVEPRAPTTRTHLVCPEREHLAHDRDDVSWIGPDPRERPHHERYDALVGRRDHDRAALLHGFRDLDDGGAVDDRGLASRECRELGAGGEAAAPE